VGNVIAQQTARQVSGSFGGVVASTVMGALGRDAVSGIFKKMDQKKKEELESAPKLEAGNTVAGQVQIFRISTEVIAVSGRRIARDRFEIPKAGKASKAAVCNGLDLPGAVFGLPLFGLKIRRLIPWHQTPCPSRLHGNVLMKKNITKRVIP